MDPNWKKYYEQTKGRPPSKLLVAAVTFVNSKIAALDLGSGALKDSRYLLAQGFEEVWAIDKEPVPEEILAEINNPRFHFIQSTFADFDFPENKFNLANASYSLPFNSPETFVAVWSSVVKSLVSNGIFAGQFFGVRDEWNTPGKDMVFHGGQDVQDLLKDFKILQLGEEERDGLTANGESKHWHVFNVIAQKTSA